MPKSVIKPNADYSNNLTPVGFRRPRLAISNQPPCIRSVSGWKLEQVQITVPQEPGWFGSPAALPVDAIGRITNLPGETSACLPDGGHLLIPRVLRFHGEGNRAGLGDLLWHVADLSFSHELLADTGPVRRSMCALPTATPYRKRFVGTSITRSRSLARAT